MTTLLSFDTIAETLAKLGNVPARARFVPIEDDDDTQGARAGQSPRFEIDPATGAIKKRAVQVDADAR